MNDDLKMTDNLSLKTIAAAFLEAALWADAPKNTSPRITREAEINACAFCAAFIKENLELFNAAIRADGYTLVQFGHDLYLTQAGHGAGFWDRAELAVMPAGRSYTLGTLLTDKCGRGTRFFTDVELFRGWAYFRWKDAA